MDATNIVSSAQELIQNHTKVELVAMARAMGWRGDHARAPILQIALYTATKLNSGERGEKHDGEKRKPESMEGKLPDWMDSQQEGKQGSQEAEGQQDGSQQAESQQDGSQQAETQQDGSQEAEGQQDGSQQAETQQDGSQEAEGQQDGSQQAETQQDGSQEAEGQQEEDEYSEPDGEFKALLKASGLKTPHPLLEKVWRLTVKAKQNVLLIGPGASGKTMIAGQLAELMKFPFSSVSCTMGMSESQLSGWLLPVGENGSFSYVPTPFVECLQTPSVFLLDEVDAADPNVLMMLNSVTSNGFITIPHKLGSPTVLRHPGSIIIAGANTTGSGADDMYSARSALDAATTDRFYTIAVDYDEAYEKSLFSITRKVRQRTPAWEVGPTVTQDIADSLHEWFKVLREQTRVKRVNRLVSTRMAQRIMAAAKARIPMDEIKADLRITWTADEIARTGV